MICVALIALIIYVREYFADQSIMNHVISTTPQHLLPSSKNAENVMYGRRIAKTKRMIVCGLVRDIKNDLPRVKRTIDRFSKMWKDFTLILVENDSSDGTRHELLKWRDENVSKSKYKIIILGCGVDNEEVCHIPIASQKTHDHDINTTRIRKMAYLRNLYVDYISKNLSTWDYMAVWDLDMTSKLFLDGVAHNTFLLENDLDVSGVCSYGAYRFMNNQLYYDTYAHIPEGEVWKGYNNKLKHDTKLRKDLNIPPTEKPFKCESCFGGFVIYKIRDVLYSQALYSTNEQLPCEHVPFNMSLPGKMLSNPGSVHYINKND